MEEQEKKWAQEKEQEQRWKQWTLDAQQKQEFFNSFHTVDADGDGFLTGSDAKIVFASSGLQVEVLGKIWSLADRNKDNKLDMREFAIAMFLIRSKQRGETLPSALPDNLVQSVYNDNPPPLPPPLNLNHLAPPSNGRSRTPSGGSEMGTSADSLSSVGTASHQRTSSGSGGAFDSSPYKTIHGEVLDVGKSSSFPPPPPLTSAADPYGLMPSPVGSPTQHPTGLSVSTPFMHARSNYGSPLLVNQSASAQELVAGKSSYQPPSVPAIQLPGGATPFYPQHASTTPSLQTTGFSHDNLADWREYETKDGRKYYHDKVSGVTTWAQPAQFKRKESSPGSPSSLSFTTLSALSSTAPAALGSTGGGASSGTPLLLRARSTSGSARSMPDVILPPESTETLLADPGKIEYFKGFLETDGQNSMILFYMDLCDFERLLKPSTANLPLSVPEFQKADAMYCKYVMKGAPFPVQLSDKTRKDIKKWFKEQHKNKGPITVPKNVFETAKQEVYNVIETEQFPRFMKSMFYIAMHNAYLSREGYDLPDLLWREFVTAAEGGADEGWEYVAETKGVLIHKKQYNPTSASGEPLVYVRGSGIIPLSPQEMHTIATNVDLRKRYEFMLKDARVVEQLDDKTVIIHIEYQPPKFLPMFSNHDFVIVRTEKWTEDGGVMILSRSVVHKDIPDRKGVNRGDLECSGYVIKPCGVGSCVVIYVTQAMLHGIPSMLASKLINRIALIIHKIRQLVEQEKKEAAKEKRDPIWRRGGTSSSNPSTPRGSMRS